MHGKDSSFNSGRLMGQRGRRLGPSRRPSSNRDRSLVIESTVKMGANMGLSVIATVALTQLWPQYQSVQTKLRDIQVEVKQTEVRVNQARSQFNHNFDASQTRSIMLEQSHLSDPNQRRIVILDKDVNE